MSRATKALEAFIEGVPDSVLDNLPARDGTIHHDANFRLDLQSTTAGKRSLQVQIASGALISTLRKFALKTVAGPILVSAENSMSGADVRAALLSKIVL